MSDKIVNLSVSRRTLMKGGALAAAAAASPCLPNLAFAEQIKKLEQEGWTKRPVACTMCGAFCGLIEMRKEGEPVSEKTVRIFPNPGHPQQGYCGRSAATMCVWNHPLRLKKPLKRVGEKGEGKFKEITWDEALDGIAGQLKASIFPLTIWVCYVKVLVSKIITSCESDLTVNYGNFSVITVIHEHIKCKLNRIEYAAVNTIGTHFFDEILVKEEDTSYIIIE